MVQLERVNQFGGSTQLLLQLVEHLLQLGLRLLIGEVGLQLSDVMLDAREFVLRILEFRHLRVKFFGLLLYHSHQRRDHLVGAAELLHALDPVDHARGWAVQRFEQVLCELHGLVELGLR